MWDKLTRELLCSLYLGVTSLISDRGPPRLLVLSKADSDPRTKRNSPITLKTEILSTPEGKPFLTKVTIIPYYKKCLWWERSQKLALNTARNRLNGEHSRLITTATCYEPISTFPLSLLGFWSRFTWSDSPAAHCFSPSACLTSNSFKIKSMAITAHRLDGATQHSQDDRQ